MNVFNFLASETHETIEKDKTRNMTQYNAFISFFSRANLFEVIFPGGVVAFSKNLTISALGIKLFK